MALTREQIIERLREVKDPQRSGDIVTLDRVSRVALCDGYVSVRLEMPELDSSARRAVRERVVEAVSGLGEEVRRVTVEFAGEAEEASSEAASAAKAEPGAQSRPSAGPSAQRAGAPPSPQQGARADNPLPGVKHVVAIGAGKGGVGKSTVAVNLAVALARRGLRAGLLDGDIYGPSTPTLLGLAEQEVRGAQNRLFPFEVHGIRVMTMGKLVDPDKPLIWRGPMAHGAFRQLAMQTDWGELDYLVIDLPPGTGDVPLTMAQMIPLSGAVIVCTPQRVAQDDAVRAVGMFRQLDVPVLGVVENMSYFIADDGREYDIFGRGGAGRMAERLGLALLGTIPIHMELRANSDAGNPTANFEGQTQLAGELEALAGNLVERVEARGAETGRPTLSIS